MRIDHVHFYVEDAAAFRDWFVNVLGFRSVTSGKNHHSRIEVVNAGAVYFVLSSALAVDSPVAAYLQQHPPGVSDIAFEVPDIESTIARAIHQGATLLQPIQTEQQPRGHLQWATIAAWGDLTHTFIERSGETPLLPLSTLADQSTFYSTPSSSDLTPFTGIDHIVLNVPSGRLNHAVQWYEKILGFQPQQVFKIQTDYSALYSQVMRHPSGLVQLPINEPASENSQIQEFLDTNGGPGIQHIALETRNMVEAIPQFRRNGLSLLHVPPSYYDQLRQRPGLPLPEESLQAIETQQILADWQDSLDSAVLLQTFTHPIFEQPTFFFELIERQVRVVNSQPKQAKGFGEGNFRALFEAIEREQLKRGRLQAENLQ
jgi:4-hydroxyphenylpyruvate dioxygenase